MEGKEQKFCENLFYIAISLQKTGWFYGRSDKGKYFSGNFGK